MKYEVGTLVLGYQALGMIVEMKRQNKKASQYAIYWLAGVGYAGGDAGRVSRWYEYRSIDRFVKRFKAFKEKNMKLIDTNGHVL